MDRAAYHHWYNYVYLYSAHWARTRAQALVRSGYRCQRCGKPGPWSQEEAIYCRAIDRLQVHHITYARLGHERPEDILVLCRECHCKVHGLPIPASAYLTWEENILRGLVPGLDYWLVDDDYDPLADHEPLPPPYGTGIGDVEAERRWLTRWG